MSARLLFAAFAPKRLDPAESIWNKFQRMLDRLGLPAVVDGKRVAVKMHLGGGGGFSTIHPFFVRKLVRAVRDAGARDVFVTDLKPNVDGAVDRGYTEEVVGCRILPVCGADESDFQTFPVNPPFHGMDRIELAGEILKADVLLDFSHIKGHGVCGFGGASKNLSMGAVTGAMRRILHGLEGGLGWDEAKCTHCGRCVANCPNDAMSFDKDGKLKVFYHNCKFCQHCVLVCPAHAVTMTAGGYLDFQKGMAMTSAKLLEHFPAGRRLFISMLMDTTIFCDCWGMTTPRLIPDIGILAGDDIVAIEQAALDLIDREELIPKSLPAGWDLSEDRSRHLFERIHHKDPYAVVRFLKELGCGTTDYVLDEVE